MNLSQNASLVTVRTRSGKKYAICLDDSSGKSATITKKML